MSIQIKKLEKEIGATLFERDARKMRLTPAGQLVQKTFASILGSYNAMLWQARSIEQEQKCLRIGYHGPSDWAGILSLFRRCLSQNPGTRIQIESAEYGELAKKLEQGKPDLAFLEAADAKGRDALKWTPLFDDYGCFAMAKEHPLAALKQIAPADLRDQTIYFNLRPSASMQTIFQKLVQSGIPPRKAGLRRRDGDRDCPSSRLRRPRRRPHDLPKRQKPADCLRPQRKPPGTYGFLPCLARRK